MNSLNSFEIINIQLLNNYLDDIYKCKSKLKYKYSRIGSYQNITKYLEKINCIIDLYKMNTLIINENLIKKLNNIRKKNESVFNNRLFQIEEIVHYRNKLNNIIALLQDFFSSK